METKRNIAFFSIKRPIFIASLAVLLIVVGFISFSRMGVDLFPDVDPASIMVTIVYQGASPEEIEKLVSKPVEDEVSSIAGLKRITSQNYEGVSVITAEFVLEADLKYAEQQLRDKVANARPNLPDDIQEPIFTKRDLSSLPVIKASLQTDLPPTKAYDLANENLKLQIQQVSNVGDVEIIGGRKREIQVELDRDKLNAFRISASTVVNQLGSAGVNVPAGKYEKGANETVFRTLGEFQDLNAIGNSVVMFSGDVSNSVTVKSLGSVIDTAEDATTLGYMYYPYKNLEKPVKKGIFGEKITEVYDKNAETRPALFLNIYRQSGANTVAVADAIKVKINKLNEQLANAEGHPRLEVVSDYSKSIKANVEDVEFTIIFGIILAVFTVYVFLGNLRSTIITGIAIPTSLLGAFILMYLFGFTLNLMSLMALSLAVGLLVDDAIVIQENIYRKREDGKHPFAAAEFGTEEVKLAVIATTLVVISVFMPVGFISGTVGGYFRPFAFSIVFAMAISLGAALTIAPLLNAYFGGSGKKNRNALIIGFDKVQDTIDFFYEKILSFTLANPIKVLLITLVIFVLSISMFKATPKTFQPEGDPGEFNLSIELPAGTSLEGTRAVTQKMEQKLRTIKAIKYYTLVIGNSRGETHKATFGIVGVPRKERDLDTNGMKMAVREAVKEFTNANPSITSAWGGSGKAFTLNIYGTSLPDLDQFSKRVMEILRTNVKDQLTEVESNYKPGKPEFQVKLDPRKMAMLGVQPKAVGDELRTYIAGTVKAKLRENGLEYDIRVRLKPSQRNLKESYSLIRVPNTQNKMIPVSAISTPSEAIGPSLIMRQDRARVIQVTANLVPGGALALATERTMKLLAKEPKPAGVTYKLVGQAEDFAALMTSIFIAFGLALLFIYLVLSSLYDSFITPISILTALPPAITGAFAALFISHFLSNTIMFDMFSMIGIIALLGLVTKNSILLVDFALEGMRAGMSQKEAIKRAGLVRLRPILMTSFAIIAGMLPLALGVGEAASYRKSMGIAIIGGVIFSTFVSLVVVPAIFEFVDKFRRFVERLILRPEIIQASEELNRTDAQELVGDHPSHAEIAAAEHQPKSKKPSKKK